MTSSCSSGESCKIGDTSVLSLVRFAAGSTARASVNRLLVGALLSQSCIASIAGVSSARAVTGSGHDDMCPCSAAICSAASVTDILEDNFSDASWNEALESRLLGCWTTRQRSTMSGNTHRAGTRQTSVGLYSERQESADAISRIRHRVADKQQRELSEQLAVAANGEANEDQLVTAHHALCPHLTM